MVTVLRAARILTPDVSDWEWIAVEGGVITGLGRGLAPAEPEDLGDVTLVPGFVDMHGHGGGGAAFTEGVDAARVALAMHRSHGTTSAMASLVTDTIDNLESQVRALRPLVDADELLGIHLEGPWLSEHHCGAHDPALLADPIAEDVRRLIEAGEGSVAMVTLAAERAGGVEACAYLREAGVIPALGHSHAAYDVAQAGIDAGATVATHLYNAERPLHHREPGLILALLERPEVVVELIADGVHVHPQMIKMAAEKKPGQFALITDAMAAAGQSDGDYRLGPLDVEVRDGVARLAGGGAIAGSTLTLDKALQFAVQRVGLGLPDALAAMTRTPADVLQRPDLGRLDVGAKADLVALNPDLTVRRVWRRGVEIPVA